MSHWVGVYGGMFDPVHSGHIEVARFALSQLHLDKLKLIPCHLPNHRNQAEVASRHRLQMLGLATADDTAIEVDDIEICRDGKSYTRDTLVELRRRAPNCKLVLVLGMDSFDSLPQWYQYENILKLCHLFVLSRPGESLSAVTAQRIDLKRHQVDTAEELLQHERGKILIFKEFEFDVSSTLIRKKLKAGEELDGSLDEKVEAYIREHELYSSRNTRIF